jgi:methylated-DNA-[protein]-cysteine S-methyltransferase
MTVMIDRMPTPLGTILLVFGAHFLNALDFSDYEDRMHHLLRRYHGPVTLKPGRTPVRKEIEAYFDGDMKALSRIPVQTGGTGFQQEVWKELTNIEAGTTRTYGEIAAAIGRPKSCRAVGAANGANPVPIVIPCHRVIGANGTLTGYGGGLDRKKWLLEHESRHL